MATAAPRRSLILTGARRGIGHATVKRFPRAGWRVITCSRHAFPGELPLGDGAGGPHPGRSRRPRRHARAPSRRCASGSKRRPAPRARQQCRHLAQGRGRRAARHSIDTPLEDWQHVFQVNFFAPIMLARGLIDELAARQGRRRQRHLDRRRARASLRRRGLCHLEGGARRADARDGRRLRPARRARQRHLARRDRHRDPVARHRQDRRDRSRCAASARRRRSPRAIYFLCTEQSSYVNGAELHINGGQHV